MQVSQFVSQSDSDIDLDSIDSANLVLVFSSRKHLQSPDLEAKLSKAFPNAHCVGCSTAGQIHSAQWNEDGIVVTAISFESTTLQIVHTNIGENPSSFDAGAKLGASLAPEKLCFVMVLSDGILVNGSDLIQGISSGLPSGIPVTGGLAGDGALFNTTLIKSETQCSSGLITLIGFYGNKLSVSYGQGGGWQAFGSRRRVTRSKNNILYDLDGQSALQLYKHYLGEFGHELPSAGLLFPLELSLTQDGEKPVVRTILGVDEKENSMTFAGNIPEGAYVRLMKSNPRYLIEGARLAGENCVSNISQKNDNDSLAILISCVGRQQVLKQRTEEELEAVQAQLPNNCSMAGFYSYGELAPSEPGGECELHNQTMTLTLICEKP